MGHQVFCPFPMPIGSVVITWQCCKSLILQVIVICHVWVVWFNKTIFPIFHGNVLKIAVTVEKQVRYFLFLQFFVELPNLIMLLLLTFLPIYVGNVEFVFFFYQFWPIFAYPTSINLPVDIMM